MLTVGIDVGGTKCLAVALQDGVVVAELRRDTPATGLGLVETLCELVEVIGTPGESGAISGVPRIGIGLPGLVDDSGVLRVAPNLRFAEGLAIGDLVEARLGGSVVIENDATCACWAEWVMGSGLGCPDMIMVTLGTGIGGGIVTKGRLMRGAHGFAGEFGHMVVNVDGPQCPCGRNGCWERYASGSGLGRLAREAASEGRAQSIVARAGGLERIRGEHVSAAATDGNPEALRIVRDLAHWVVVGLANLVQVLDPQAIVVGGGLVSMGEALLEPVRSELDRLLGGHRIRSVAVMAAALGERAGAIGAALIGTS